MFLYSRWGLKRWVSCLLKWKRDRGSILERRLSGEEKEKVLKEQLAIKERELAEVDLHNRQLSYKLDKERRENYGKVAYFELSSHQISEPKQQAKRENIYRAKISERLAN